MLHQVFNGKWLEMEFQASINPLKVVAKSSLSQKKTAEMKRVSYVMKFSMSQVEVSQPSKRGWYANFIPFFV